MKQHTSDFYRNKSVSDVLDNNIFYFLLTMLSARRGGSDGLFLHDTFPHTLLFVPCIDNWFKAPFTRLNASSTGVTIDLVIYNYDAILFPIALKSTVPRPIR